MSDEGTRYYLEMTHPSALHPSRKGAGKVEIKQQQASDPALSRYLYTTVGQDWHWRDRLSWTDDQWCAYLNQAHIEMWVAYAGGTPAGYFELAMDPQQHVEIAYFGLLPQYIGQGLGGHLLTVALERAWQMGATRVWLHTSTRDHPSALANYQARGLRVFKQESL